MKATPAARTTRTFLNAAAKALAITALTAAPIAASAATIAQGETKTIDELVKQDRWSKQLSTLVFTGSAQDANTATLLINRFDVASTNYHGITDPTAFDADGTANERLVLAKNKAGEINLTGGAQLYIGYSVLQPQALEVVAARGGWLQLNENGAFAFNGVPTDDLIRFDNAGARNTSLEFDQNFVNATATAPVSGNLIGAARASGGTIHAQGSVAFADIVTVSSYDAQAYARATEFAEAKGGVFFVKDGSLDFSKINSLTLADSTGNAVAGLVAGLQHGEAFASGGAIASENSAVSFAGIKEAFIDNNTVGFWLGTNADIDGTAVAVAKGGAISITGESLGFDNINNLTLNGNGSFPGAGSAVHVRASSATSLISADASILGGAIYAGEGASVSFTNIKNLELAGNGWEVYSRVRGFTPGATDPTVGESSLKALGGAINVTNASLAISADYLNISNNTLDASLRTNGLTGTAGEGLAVIARGGAVYTENATAPVVVNVGVDARFTGNAVLAWAGTGSEIGTGIAQGGAFYTKGSNLTFDAGHDLYFANNTVLVSTATQPTGDFSKTVQAEGGAIYLESGTLEFVGTGDVRFANNTAEVEDITLPVPGLYQAAGGAILVRDGELNFNTTGSLYFTGNTVTAAYNNNAAGGAIAVEDSTINLSVVKGKQALFTANIANNTTGSWGSFASAIHLHGDSNFNIVNQGLVAIDGLTGIVNPEQRISINQTANSTGCLTLAGWNAFSIDATVSSSGEVHIDINGGSIGLSQNAQILLDGAGIGTFTLGEGATLVSTGIIGSSTAAPSNKIEVTGTAGGITLKTGSTLAFDIASNLGPVATDVWLQLAAAGVGKLVVENGVKLDLANLNAYFSGAAASTTFALVDGGNFSAVAGNEITLRGENRQNTRADNSVVQLATSSTGVTITHSTFENAVSTWAATGATAEWNIKTQGDWNGFGTNNAGAITAPIFTQFLHGDVVNFANDGDAKQTINVNAGGVYTAGIYFSGNGHYVFTGGNIEAHIGANDSAFDISGGAAATGKLILGAIAVDDPANTTPSADASGYIEQKAAFTGTVDFTQSGENAFGGVELRGGTLRIASLANIGGGIGVDFTSPLGAPATLALASNILVDGHDNADQRLVLGINKEGRILLENGVALDIVGSAGVTNGGWLELGPRSVFTIEGQGANTLAFEHNAAEFGGALYAYDGAVNIKNVANVSFEANKVTGAAGAVRGGAAYTSTLNITGADKVSFADNKAVATGGTPAFGGALYVNSGLLLDTIGELAFTGNVAEGGSLTGGGAILSSAEEATFSNITTLNFAENKAIGNAGFGAFGGAFAISGSTSANIAFESIQTLAFTKNYAGGGGLVIGSGNGVGGAIAADAATQTLAFADITTLTFAQNLAEGQGGAIWTEGHATTFERVNAISFTHNEVVNANNPVLGGALYSGPNGTVLFKDVPTLVFAANKAIGETTASGGAIVSVANGTLHFDTLGTVSFDGNIAKTENAAVGAAPVTSTGGAISAAATDSLVFTKISDALSFTGNKAVSSSITQNGTAQATSRAGAVRGFDLRVETVKTVTFANNAAEATAKNKRDTPAFITAEATAQSGALYTTNALFTDIETLAFTGNTAKAFADVELTEGTVRAEAGAIGIEDRATGDGRLTIEKVGTVTFANNTAIAETVADYRQPFGASHAALAAGGALATLQNNTADVRFADISTLAFDANKAVATHTDRNSQIVWLRGHGGAIDLVGTLDFDNVATLAFTNNEATAHLDVRTIDGFADVTARGGVINQADGFLTFTDVGSLKFENNTVSATREHRTVGGTFEAQGGALRLDGVTLVLDTKGNVTFSGNTVIGDTLAQGGAIYSDTGAIQLDVAAGKTVLFTGNTVKEGLRNVEANSIHFEGRNEFTIVNAGTLDLRDPITSTGGATDILHGGSGVFKIGGRSELVQGNLDILSGTLHLYREGEVANASAANPNATVDAAVLNLGIGDFFLRRDATLSVGGGNAITADTLTFERGSTVILPLAFHDDVNAAKGLLSLTADTLAANAVDFNIVGGVLPKAGESITLINVATGDGSTFATNGKLLLNGQGSAVDRRVTGVLLGIDANNHTDLVLNGIDLANASLVWTGAENGEWSNLTGANSPHNWTNRPGATPSLTQFVNGDSVLFTDAAVTKEVKIGAAGVNVAAFVVDTADKGENGYYFTGGPIAGDTAFIKRGEGNVAFGSANAFTGGTVIEDGIVTLFAANALGSGLISNSGVLDLAYSGSLDNNVIGSGYVYVRPTSAVTFEGSITNTTLFNEGVARLNEVVIVPIAQAETVIGVNADKLLEVILNRQPPVGDGPLLEVVITKTSNLPVAVNTADTRGVTHRWGDVVNNGLIDFVKAGNTLEVASLRSTNGATGRVRMDVDLLDKTRSDKLIVTGAITGSQHFLLTDVSEDPNAIKRTSGAGHLLVQAGDVSQADVTGKLIAGAYTFNLQSNGSNGYTLGSATGYSPVAQTTIALAATSAPAWFSQLDSLNKRFGEFRLGVAADKKDVQAKEGEAKSEGEADVKKAAPKSPSNDVWVRAHGQRINTDLGIAGVSEFSEYQYGGDVGYDHEFKFSNSSVFLGAFVGYQHASRSFRDGYGSSSDTDTTYVGAYATWIAKCGFYVDGVVKGQYSDSEFRAFTSEGGFNNSGYGASIEAGKQFVFGAKSAWFFEPSLQFDYLHVTAKDYSTSDGLRVKNGDSDIFRFAGGLRLGRTVELAGSRLQPYVRAGVESQFSYGGGVRVADAKLEPNTDGTRLNLGLGVAWQVSESAQLHFDYESSFGDKYERPWGVNAGVRFRF